MIKGEDPFLLDIICMEMDHKVTKVCLSQHDKSKSWYYFCNNVVETINDQMPFQGPKWTSWNRVVTLYLQKSLLPSHNNDTRHIVNSSKCNGLSIFQCRSVQQYQNRLLDSYSSDINFNNMHGDAWHDGQQCWFYPEEQLLP